MTPRRLAPVASGRATARGKRIGLAWVVVCSLCGAAVAQERIVLDSRRLSIGFEVYSFGIWRLTGAFTEAVADISFDARQPNLSRLKVAANTASVSTTSPAADAQLRSANFFNAGRYPTLSFESTRIEFSGPNDGVVFGNLSLLGVTRPLKLTFRAVDGASADSTRSLRPTSRIRATGVLRRSEWGMTALAPAISDEVRLEIEAELRADR